MVVMNDGMQLPQVLERLNHADLKWISEFDLQHQAVSVGVGPPHWITLRRRSTPHLRQVRDSGSMEATT